MGIKPVETKVFLEYLKYLGLVKIRHESSHHVYDYEDTKKRLDRPLIVRIKDQYIPLLHMHTNLKTLGKSHKDFEEWFKKPKMAKKKGN